MSHEKTFNIVCTQSFRTELGTFKWDILNPDRLFNLEINNRGEQALFYLKIKEKRRSSIDLDIHHSKVFSSELGTLEWWISGLMLNPLFLLISRLT